MSRGRPHALRPEMLEGLAETWERNPTIGALAKALGATDRTVRNWLRTRPEFAAALQGQSPEPPPVTRAPAEVFSIGAWGIPRDRIRTPHVPNLSEDDVDDLLHMGAAA